MKSFKIRIIWLFLFFFFSITGWSQNRRLALLVGVGHYPKSSPVRSLDGPTNDVTHMAALLSGPNGFGFEKENMVVLKDQQATLEGIRKQFLEHLIAKARPDDLVLFYFSGHGAQVCDLNGDESDGMDETLVCYNSRTGPKDSPIPDLVDDELQDLVRQIPARQVVVILDACHSGTGRNDWTNAKWHRAMDCGPGGTTSQTVGDKGALMLSPQATHPGLIVLSAVSADDQLAFEGNGASNFTATLLQVLSQPDASSLTWLQLAISVKEQMRVYHQVPLFNGDLSKMVFNFHGQRQPAWWHIRDVTQSSATATGLPLPGWSAGGIVAVYPSAMAVAQGKEGAEGGALFSIQSANNGFALLKPLRTAWLFPVKSGDIVVLLQAGNDLSRLGLHLQPSGLCGGLSPKLTAEIKAAIEGNPLWSDRIEVRQEAAEFHVSQTPLGSLEITDQNGRVRNSFRPDESGVHDLVRNLWLFSLQKYLLQLKLSSGDPVPALDVSLLSFSDKTVLPCDNNSDQILRNGQTYGFRVAYRQGQHTSPLKIGGIVLSSDGSVTGFPFNGQYPVLQPGQHHDFSEAFAAGPPFGLDDYVVFFGTPPENPLYWDRLFLPSNSGSRSTSSPLADRQVFDFLFQNRRQGTLVPAMQDSPIVAISSLRMVVVSD